MLRSLPLVFVFALTLGPFAASLGAAPTAQDVAQILKGMGLTPLPQMPASQDFRLENPVTGKSISLSEYRGRWVLLNFWATWCAPCLEEIPSLDSLVEKIPEQSLVVLAVSSGEQKTVVAEYLKKSPHRFTVLLDTDQGASKKYGVRALPTTYLVDPQGRVVGGKSGALYWDSSAVLEGFARLTS